MDMEILTYNFVKFSISNFSIEIFSNALTDDYPYEFRQKNSSFV